MKATVVTAKVYYDDAMGNPVDITSIVLESGDLKESNLLEQIDSYGVAMNQHVPGGKGKIDAIPLTGLFETGAHKFDDLFGGRVPEDPNTETRTLKLDMFGDGTYTKSVETHLESYTTVMVKRNGTGLIMATANLQPTGDLITVRPT